MTRPGSGLGQQEGKERAQSVVDKRRLVSFLLKKEERERGRERESDDEIEVYQSVYKLVFAYLNAD